MISRAIYSTFLNYFLKCAPLLLPERCSFDPLLWRIRSALQSSPFRLLVCHQRRVVLPHAYQCRYISTQYSFVFHQSGNHIFYVYKRQFPQCHIKVRRDKKRPINHYLRFKLIPNLSAIFHTRIKYCTISDACLYHFLRGNNSALSEGENFFIYIP